MKVELPIRWAERSMDPDAIEERKNKRIINGEDLEGDEEEVALYKYHYDYIVVDTNDIRSFHRMDEMHTILKFYDMEQGYIVRMQYEMFKDIFTELTREIITEIRTEQVTSIEEEGEEPEIKEEDLL